MARKLSQTEPDPEDLSVQEQNRQREERVLRLKSRVQAAGGPKRFSEISGIPLGSLNEWMAGRDMRLSVIPRLAEACGVAPSWLAFGEEGIVPTRPQLGEDDGFTSRFASIPRYDVQASAGMGALTNSEQVVDYLSFDKDWLRRLVGRSPDRLAVIEARGDSMEPTIRDGDLLLVDLASRHIASSAIHIIQVNGVLLAKRLTQQINGAVRIHSDNPRYHPEEMPPENLADLRIVGQVIWQGGQPR